MIRTFAIACLLLTTTITRAAEVDPAVLRAEAERIEVMDRACKTAVAVFDPGGKGGGSGVVVSADGYVLSNFHVTDAAGEAMKCGMADGRLYDGVIVGLDPVGDVALIKLLGRDDFPFAKMADSDRVQVGQWVFAVGNPFLLASDLHPTVTYGIVSGVHRYQYPSGTLLEYTDCIQTDASINPGNSGGPLFNDRGELIGINGRGSFEKRGRVNVGVGYAISINQIKNFFGYLKSGRIVDHATLGATVASDEDGRVLVKDVLDTSDAYRRGLRYGDEIVSFGGRRIDTANAFKNVLGIYPKGWQVPLTYRRQGKTYDVVVRLAGVHSERELIEKTVGRKPVEKPEGDDPDDKPDSPQPADPEAPKPDGHANPQAKPMPKIVREHYVRRSGFANYYFNRLNRDRVWSAFVATGDFQSPVGPWTLSGSMLPAGDAEFVLRDGAVACSLPGGKLNVPMGEDLSGTFEPAGSGGLLAALHLWRRMLLLGPEKFGDVTYLGSMPLAGHDKPVDVLVAVHAGVESRFMFDVASGRLVKLELYLQADDDPCELSFTEYQEVAGRWLPTELEVRRGDQLYGAFKFSKFDLSEKAE